MTQEELDALMSGDIDLDEDLSEDEVLEEIPDEPYNETDPALYRVSATHNWPPPPPTDDNKMVHQLDDVTKESEEKASEIFDLVDSIGCDLADGEKSIKKIKNLVTSNIELFNTLTVKFPNIEAFKTQLEQNEQIITELENLEDMFLNDSDTIMNIMDIMQYQDIHRQKIERVINVMRALSTYMNHLFSGKIDDSKRVSSAVHLPGDTATDEVVSNEDIEALLASFGAK